MGTLRTPLLFLLLQPALPLVLPQLPPPCEQQVEPLKAEIQVLNKVISDQQRYIQELHRNHDHHLEQMASVHLGAGNAHRDCSDVFADGNVASGVYVIRPDGSPTALSVYCDMNNGGGWTVLQRRRDGKEDFDRAWVEYKHGFGDMFSPDGEFWLGNEPLHHLTSQGNYELRINMEDFEGNQRYAEYKNFIVDDEKVTLTNFVGMNHEGVHEYAARGDEYQLHLGEYTGNAGDALANAHTAPPEEPTWAFPGIKFSTYDHLNDSESRCIRHSKSGWWFSRCDSGNLNGHYYKGPYQAMADDGVVWYTWHGWWYSIKSVVMMVRADDLKNPAETLTHESGGTSP